MLLIALQTVDAPEIARIDGFDREEDRLATALWLDSGRTAPWRAAAQ
jgi:hypothetical protein